MEKRQLPLKKLIAIGVFCGLFHASGMALFDYFDGDAFSIKQFAFYSICFCVSSVFIFRKQLVKIKN